MWQLTSNLEVSTNRSVTMDRLTGRTAFIYHTMLRVITKQLGGLILMVSLIRILTRCWKPGNITGLWFTVNNEPCILRGRSFAMESGDAAFMTAVLNWDGQCAVSDGRVRGGYRSSRLTSSLQHTEPTGRKITLVAGWRIAPLDRFTCSERNTFAIRHISAIRLVFCSL